MTNATHRYIVLGASILILASAPLLAPTSCEGGLAAYFWIGIVTVVALSVLPFVLRQPSRTRPRILRAMGGIILGTGAWVGGLFLANFRIICRLF